MTFEEELYQLNERYYSLFGQLYENVELMDEKTVRYMSDKIFAGYKQEYEALAMKWSIAQKQEIFELKVKHNAIVPRNRFIFFPNRAKKLTLKELGAELGEVFKAREDAYNALYGGDKKQDDTPPDTAAEQPAAGQTEQETQDKDVSA